MTKYRPYAILDETRTWFFGIVHAADDELGLAGRVGARLDVVVLEGDVPGGETLFAEEIPDWMAEEIEALRRAHPNSSMGLFAVSSPLLDEELPGRRKLRLSAFETAEQAAEALITARQAA